MSEKVPTLIRGTLYESQREAARKLGISLGAVQHAINSGNPNSAGMGRNWNMKRPVIIDGVQYESMADGARAISAPLEGIRTVASRMRRSGEVFRYYKGHKVEVLK